MVKEARSLDHVPHHLPMPFRLSALPDFSFWSRIAVPDNSLIQRGVTLILAAYFIRLSYNHFIRSQSLVKPRRKSNTQAVRNFFFKSLSQSPPTGATVVPNNACPTKITVPRIKQPFEVLLVLDIEGTCDLKTDYNYPNEIIVRANMTSRIILNDYPRNCLFVCCAGRTERTMAEQARWNLLRSFGHLFDPRGNRHFRHFVHS